MQSLTLNNYSRGQNERLGTSDLSKFSLDLNWARGVTEATQPSSYPSPPMSGSPPFSSKATSNSSGLGHGGFGTPSQNVSSGLQTPQPDSRIEYRSTPVGYYPPPQTSQPQAPTQQQQQQAPYGSPASYGPLPRLVDAPPLQSAYQYPPRLQPMSSQTQPPQNSGQTFTPYQETRDPYASSDGQSTGMADSLRENSPKGQRKAKGHVAAACVPCKRAHLKCDSARPCSRCSSTGKEDSCIDTQHKKRGRPRLRDERETRYDAGGPGYPAPMDTGMRRPMSMYASSGGSEPIVQDAASYRSGSYRVLKSQSGAQRRHPDMPSPLSQGSNSGQQSFQSRLSYHGEIPCAYLSLELQIERASRSLSEVLGLQELPGQRLMDLVIAEDREIIYRLQQDLEHERRQRDAGFLPPIYRQDRERGIIHSLGMSGEEISNYRLERQEVIAIQAPGGYTPRRFQIRVGLEKIESTYFVVLVVDLPQPQSTPQPPPDMRQPYAQAPSGPPYGQASQAQDYNPRPASFGGYGQLSYNDVRPREQPPAIMHQGSFGAQGTMYGGPSTSQPIAQPTTPSYAQPFPSPGYPPQQLREIPRSHLPPGQQQPPVRASEFQLPPIRAAPIVSPRRLDIEGLLEDPKSVRDRR